ncbi:YebC/PmpR family DNA-binding transcriptional regulator [Candidatus Shapirobacteria bacterium CG03_land_8_20_14_0_80_40_19]|uniref:Probable transcriptional regulatory protein COS55_01490 n=2 Tax=Candidatus Shapironibacteriota TaxID=1752721 RepID=A0A2M7BEW4_9BACT|nr:MAG: YebC/PmpR family DNA-binding transcriptional regulator [Candidatus Shapirobacteria bacterium CG11_big_fil_rev_8_21_14_0_20_40_12]PIV01682.1 MAG: YebC/PmpR family DNA-binding transcriptional regulator [Candidatus Shapirobacteria bacterium CG03_land_8_20_14_0_80_40_19]
MSGHSKWAKIHRAKEASDQKKGQSFTKLSNAIAMAVREGNGITDPEFNFRLRLAIEKAREANMPKDNIARAIDKGGGKGEGSALEEILYEGYGPGGVGFLVQSVTDNRQRTVQEVKNIFDRSGGAVASPGAVSFNFKKVGYLTVNAGDKTEEVMLKLIDLGVEDVEDEGEGILGVYTNAPDLISVKDKISGIGLQPQSAEIIMKPINYVSVTDQRTIDQILSLVNKLEELDDIQKVFVNF